MQGLREFFRAECDLFAYRERGSVVVDPEGEKLHDGGGPEDER